MKKILIVLILLSLIGLIGLALFSFSSSSSQDSSQPQTNSSVSGVTTLLGKMQPSPSPIPFQELTIPYLRQQSFQSSLTKLEEVKSNATLRGYLTSYKSEGLTIDAYLAIPNQQPPQKGFPAVVLVHGYIPPQNYQTLSNYVSFADALAAQGIIVLKIDLRGHANSQGEASGAYYSSDYIIDTLHAYDALQKLDQVNPNKVGLWGHSMGGNVVVRSMAVQPTIPKVIVWAGAVYTYQDFGDFGIDDNSYQPPAPESDRQQRRDELFETHGRFSADSEFWQQVPATNYLDEIEGEIHIHHAINDNVVSIDYSRNAIGVFNQAGITNQLYEYQSGGHNLTGTSFNQAIQRTADFLKE